MTLIHSLSPAAIRARELLEDPETTEVHFNGAAHWSVKTGGTLRVLDGYGFSDERELVAWCNRLLEESGCAERLDGMTPVVEFAFVGPEVSARVHIVTEPVAPHTVVTVAKQTTRRITMAELVANDTLSAEMEELIQLAVRGRLNVVVSGGTGAGKTTFMQAMLALCDPNERIGVIEEIPELRLSADHTVYLRSRAVPSSRRTVAPEVMLGALADWAIAIAEAGERGQAEVSLPRLIEALGANLLAAQGSRRRSAVSLATLVRESLRMRFDRIVVGEVRGPEVVDLLGAMNSGFEGSSCTLHANSAMDTVAKIQLLAASHESHLQPSYVQGLIADAVDLIVYLAPPGLDQHRVGEILAVFPTHAGANVITHERLFRFDPKEGFMRTAALPHQLVQRLKRGGVFVDAAGR